MRILRLHLKRKWWEQIRDGEKEFEFRLVTPYWKKRLIGREYDEIHFLLGYPKAGDMSRTLVRKWGNIGIATMTHEEFGPEPVEVYIIPAGKP